MVWRIFIFHFLIKVVGGIVGIKIPRYCVFGEPIIVCKHMMQHGQSQMILIGEVVKAALPPSYTVNDKGKVAIEGKGQVIKMTRIKN